MTRVTLSTIGSRGVTVDVSRAAVEEAGPGGVSIRLGLPDGPLTLTLTAGEAEQLAAAIIDLTSS